MVAGVLLKSSWRFYRQHPLQLLLGLVGIILGVGIVTAVLITNSSSKRAFALSTEALYGKTTHHITGADGVDQHVFAWLRKNHPDITAAPVIEGLVTLDNTVLSLVGLDPFSEVAFARFGEGLETSEVATIDDANLMLSQTSAARLEVMPGDSIKLLSNLAEHEVTISALLRSENPAVSNGLLVGDIARVQSLLGRAGVIDRIDLVVTTEQVNALTATLPNTLKLNNAASRNATMLAMTRGFQINLTAMSLLSLLVGAFLIHNTMSFTVLQRRELFAVKRTIGISSQSLFYMVVAEAFLISLTGSAIGLLCGRLLAEQLIQLTTQTINDLYFVLHVQEIWFTPAMILLGLALGTGTSVLAASISASEAASVSPIQSRQRSETEKRTRQWLPLLGAIGVVCLLFGLAVATTKTLSLLAGFIALILLIIGYGLLIPGVSYLLSSLVKRASAGTSPILSMAAGSIERNISRTGLAITALSVAVASTFGVDIMIGSFRSSVDTWLQDTLQSDVYISIPSTASTQSDGILSRKLLVSILNTSEIKSISTGLKLPTQTPFGEFDTLALTPHNDEPVGITLINSTNKTAWNRFINHEAVLISEPLATKYQLQADDPLTLFTERIGDHTFEIAGIIRDYASSHGQITMHRRTFDVYWNRKGIETIGIVFNDDVDKANATAKLQSVVTAVEQPVRLQANHAIHRDSLAIFDRTFEVTKVLRWLTVGVAFVGIFSALLALNLERAREFAVLRATGITRKQLIALITCQTVWMGLLAGLLALPLGWIMSEILIHVINLRSFGWSMASFIPPGSIQSTLLLASSSALLAGLFPAWRLSQSPIATQLRQD